MSRTIRTLIIFGAPVLVGVLNLFHPVYLKHTDIYDGLHAFSDWWIMLHVLNLFGFALLGLAAYLLILERHGIAATVAKAALLLFVPSYAGFDSIIGIATGNLMRYASGLPLDQLPALKTAIDAFWNNGVATLLAIVGSVSWSLAMSASAISLVRSRRAAAVALGVIAGAFTGWGYSANMFSTLPWWIGVTVIAAISLLVVRPALPFTLLILAGILFGTSHIPPFGPFGMAFFVAAVAIIQTAPSRVSTRETSAPAGVNETQ